ncbi:MAG: nucleotidyltransferase domain-containing protein [Gemmatimonadota bacterium]
MTAQLAAMPEVQQVVLFGSYAAGRRDLFTDLDLIVVMDSPLDFVSRNANLAGRVHAGVALDLLVYTPEEMERMRDRSFMRHALATGKVLYARQAVR